MAKAVALWTGGISFLIEVAAREDGAIFQRFQDKDPRYGYRWGAWKATGEKLGHNALANPETTRQAGFSTLYLERPSGYRFKNGKLRVRLPN